MNPKVFEFLQREIAGETDLARRSTLMTIEGYLKAAKKWRASCTRRNGHEYLSASREVEQYDIDCSIAER